MDISYDNDHVIESLTNKLAQAEQRASKFEAAAIGNSLKVEQLEKDLAQEKAENAGPITKKEGKDEK